MATHENKTRKRHFGDTATCMYCGKDIGIWGSSKGLIWLHEPNGRKYCDLPARVARPKRGTVNLGIESQREERPKNAMQKMRN